MEKWKVPYWLTDAAFASMALQLLALENNIESCFFGLFDQEESVKEHFGIPENFKALGSIAFGYSDSSIEKEGRSKNRNRRPLSDVLHHGRWSPTELPE